MMTIAEIAEAFSKAEMDKIESAIAENTVWEMVQETKIMGKEAVLARCRQLSEHFNTATAYFNLWNIIAEKNRAVVSGSVKLITDNKKTAYISICDVFEFNAFGKIQKITSFRTQSE